MPRSFEYSVLRVIPDARRGECVNVGIIVFLEQGVDVRMLPTFAKVSALNAKVDTEQLRDLRGQLERALDGISSVRERHGVAKQFGIVSLTELGKFETSPSSEYEQIVSRLMSKLVTPVPPDRVDLRTSTRITTTLKSRFRAKNILGADVNDLAKHLVVPNYPIDEDEGLYADFVLKNGSYHVTETADLRVGGSGINRLRIAGLTAIKLHKALDGFGKRSKRFVVYAAHNTSEVSRPINLIGDQADAIFNLHSREDMAEYMEYMMEAASMTRSTTTKTKSLAKQSV